MMSLGFPTVQIVRVTNGDRRCVAAGSKILAQFAWQFHHWFTGLRCLAEGLKQKPSPPVRAVSMSNDGGMLKKLRRGW
jgi:hypothetical protein